MINIEEYQEAFKAHPETDYWLQVRRLQRYGKKLLAEVERLTALFEETNHHLDLMVEAFGIEALVELIGEEK